MLRRPSSAQVGRSDVAAQNSGRGCCHGRGQMFAGNPDSVARQIKEFRRRVGGVHHIIMMTRQGLVTHAEAEKSFNLAAKEVLPQLQGLPPIDHDETVWEARREAAAK